MKNFNLLITFLSMVSFATAQNVTGNASGEDGIPIVGATVHVAETNKGISTDFDGNYSIEAPSGSTLVFSFIGYLTNKVVVGSDTTINVVMSEDVQGLDQVVVIGYGSQKKAAVSGSTVTLSNEDIIKRGVSNLTQAIVGNTPGVIAVQAVGIAGQDDAKLFIRGKGTLGDSGALIVIDGIPDRGSFGRLNPDDIESLTVLKDASAAIYGARAANGVILITTKRGRFNKAPTFNVTTSYTVSSPTVETRAIDSWKWAQYEKDQIDNLSLGWATTFQ